MLRRVEFDCLTFVQRIHQCPKLHIVTPFFFRRLLQVGAVIKGKFQQTVRSVQFQFVTDALPVLVHGSEAQVEAGGDFFVDVIPTDKFKDASL